MIKQGHVGTVELFSLLTVYQSITIFYNLPSLLTQRAATGAWLLKALTNGAGFLMFIPVYLLMRKFPGKSIVEIAEDFYGRAGSFITGVLLGGFYLYVFTHFLRVYGDSVIITMLVSTPLYATMTMAILVSVMLCYLGLEAITRTGLIFAPFMVIGAFMLVILSVPNVDLTGMTPLLGIPLLDHTKNAFQLAPVVHDTLFLTLWAPFIRKEKGIFGLVGWAFLAVTVMNVALVILVEMVFPYPECSSIPFPVYQVARMIYFSRFVQRVEALTLITAVIAASIHLASLLFNCILALSQGLKLNDWRPVIFPVAVMSFAMAFLPTTTLEAAAWYYSIPNSIIYSGFHLGFPVLFYASSFFLGKKGGNKLEVQKS